MGDNAGGEVEAGTGRVAQGAASGAWAGPAGAAIGAGGSLLGSIFGSIGQGRENQRQARAAGRQAATLNELIESSIMQGAEREQAALRSAGGLREALRQGPGASAFQGSRDITRGGRDITRGGFDPRDGGMDISRNAAGMGRGDYSGVRDSTGRDRLLESASNIRASDTAGLEAAATRTLRQNQGQLGAQLAGAGAFGSGVNARQQRQMQADTFSNLASEINQDRFARQQAAAGLEAQAMADQLQREGLVLEDIFGRDQVGMQDRTQRDVTMFQGDLQRDLGFMQDRTSRAVAQQGDELSRATAMLGDDLARDQLYVNDRQARDLGALQDQLQRSGMLLDDQFRRGQTAGTLVQGTPGYGFYDPSNRQVVNDRRK